MWRTEVKAGKGRNWEKAKWVDLPIPGGEASWRKDVFSTGSRYGCISIDPNGLL